MSKASDRKWFEKEIASARKSDQEEKKRNKEIINNWNKKYPNHNPKNNTKNTVSKQLANKDIATSAKKPTFNTNNKANQVNIQNSGKSKATSNAKNRRRTANTGAGELSKVMNTNGGNARTYNQIRESKAGDRIGNATKGTVKNVGSSFMNTFATMHGNISQGRINRENQNAYTRQRGSNDRRWVNKTSEEKRQIKESVKQTAEFNKKRRNEIQSIADKASADIQEKASKLRAAGNADIEKAKEGLGKAGQFGIDLYSQMLQWAGDATIGAATGTGILAPMFLRSFGDSSMTARESGASKNKQLLVGALSGSVEAATEKLFSPFDVMKNTAGKGILDNVAERTAYNLTKKLTKQGVSKDLTYKIVKNAVKAGSGMIEEGSEEVVSDLFQPAIESIYDKNAIEQYKHPIKTGYLQQMGSDFVMGAAMSGALGGGSAIVNKAKGTQKTATFSESEKTELIKAGKAQGEKSEAYSFATSLEKQQSSGEAVLNEQVVDLANKIYQEQYKTEKAMIEKANIAEQEYVQNLHATAGTTDMMKNDRRVGSEVEQVMVDQVMAKRVAGKAAEIESMMTASGRDAETSKAVSTPIARIVLGTATAQDFNVAAVGNEDARAIIEMETGVKLPFSNQSTIDELSIYAAGMKARQKEGVIKEARQEAREMASQALTVNLDEQTAAIFNKGMEDIDFKKLPEYVAGFNLYYQGGQVNYDYGKILKTYDKVIPEAVKMAAYNAGNQIYHIEQEQVKQAQKKVVKSKRRIGNLTMSEKNEKQFGKEKSAALNTFVQVTGKNVVVVDQIDVAGQKDVANGKYQDGTIYISAKSQNPIFDVLKHELTHNLQETAPEAYNELKQFVFKKFYEADQKKYDAKIRGMIDRYARNGVDLTVSQAEDELLADATDVFFKDVDMIESLVNENRSLAEKLVDGIRALLDTLHRMASGNKKGDWLEALGIVEEAQSLWAKALNESIGVKAVSETKEKYSLKDNEGNSLSENQAEYFKKSKVRDNNGHLKVMYHGTSRADRVGNYFDPERATSGPMAFFTDNKDIADNYSKDKQDTSINYDNEYDSYETQFRINYNGKDMSIVELWGKLSNAEREEIKTKAKEIAFDDDVENIITIPGNNIGNGSYDLRYAKGNALQALVDSWLNSGDLINEESRFMEVLELAGVEGVYYNDPYLRDEKVYETYLNVVNPMSTADIDQSLIADLKTWLESADLSVYESESANSDMWDKRNRNPLEWVESLERDIEKGTTHAWTSIPDAITAYLKDKGYDGIIDQGGKNGGDIHTVVIPFYSEQIKSVANENPTTDTDIRYQMKESEIKRFNIDKTQVLANMKAVTEMNPVTTLTGKEFAKGQIDLVTQVSDYFDSIGNEVHHPVLGDISLEHKGVKSSIGHGVGRMKAVAFKSLTEVIENGKIIDAHYNWKMRGYDTIVLSAPIKIWNLITTRMDDYYVGVVVNRDTSSAYQGYYLHELEMVQKNSVPSKTAATQSGSTRGGNTASLFSLLQQLNDVNSLTINEIVSDVGKFQIKDDSDNLKQKVSELEKTNKKLKAEFKRSKFAEPEPKQTGIAVSRLIEAYLGKRNGILHESVMTDVKQVFAEMRKPEGNWNLIDDLCLNVADKITDKMEILHDEMWTDYKGLRDTLRKTTLRLSENYWNDIDDFNELRKSHFGIVKLSKNSGIPIDTFYQELAETHPGVFDAQEYTNEVDQLYNILEVVESIKPYVEEYSEGEIAEFRDTIAKDVLQMSYDLAQKKTFADLKHEEKMKAVDKVKAERNALMKKQKERMKSRLDKKDEFYKNKINDIKQQNKDKKEKKYYTSRIEAYTQWMSESLLRPTETKHIPHGYAKAIATMLSGFDFSTTRTDNWTRKYGPSRRTMKLAELRNEYEKLAKNEDSTIEIDESIQDALSILSAELDGKRFSDLSIDELEQVYRLIKHIRFSLSTMNKTFSDGLKESISEYGDTIIADNATMKAKKQYEGFRGEINRFFNETNINPIDMFETVGGKMFELYQNMRRGFDKHIDNVSQGKDFIAELAKKYKVKKWIDDNARAKKFTLENGGIIELVPSQVMSLYCLMNREQAVDHILGSGITASPIGVVDKTRQKLTKSFAKRRLSDAQVMPTIDDVKRIIGSLTAEQKKVADELQSFMGTTCSEWGNETSMKLYGYKKFTEKHYFPIKSSDAFLDESFDKVQASKIKNVGFTKNTVMKANNPIVVDDIFNVFTQHVNTMSMYNSLVPALTDFERVYNYKQRNSDGKISATVQKSIQQSFGDNVNNYIRRFVNDVNQNHARNNDTNLSNKLLANYKKAKIGANLRVLVQQPTAIVRAATVINPAYLMTPGKISLKEMQEHCQIARWKSWGFYNTDVSRSMRDIFIGKRNIVDTLFMEMYGKADDITWATIWSGVKKEINSKRKDLKPGTDAYWKAVNERFSYVVDRTQVVDSVFHRSQIMRSQDLASKMITSFMAEPTKTFNMMRTELVLAGKDFKNGNKKGAAARVSRVTSVYVANAVAVSMAAALIDALRARGEDDDDKDYLERWQNYILENFIDNANPANLLPLLRDVSSMAQGFEVSRMDMDGIADLVNSIKMWSSDKYTIYEKTKLMASAISSVTGIPLGNVTRDAEAAAKQIAKCFVAEEYIGYLSAKYRYDITLEENRPKFMAYYIKAMKNGDMDVARMIEDDMKANGVDSEYIGGRISKAFSKEFKTALESNDADKIESEASRLIDAGVDRESVDKKVKTALGGACDDALENEDLGTAYEVINTMEEYGVDYDYILGKKRNLAVYEIASYIRVGRMDRAYADAYDYHDDYNWKVNALIEGAKKIAYGN